MTENEREGSDRRVSQALREARARYERELHEMYQDS